MACLTEPLSALYFIQSLLFFKQIEMVSLTWFVLSGVRRGSTRRWGRRGYARDIAPVPEDIPVDRTAEFIDRRFAPATWMVAKCTTTGDGCVQSGNYYMGVSRWRAIALHCNQPRRWVTISVLWKRRTNIRNSKHCVHTHTHPHLPTQRLTCLNKLQLQPVNMRVIFTLHKVKLTHISIECLP